MILKKIQKIKTTDGVMIPIYRDWDKDTNEGHRPRMVYATTVNPGISKDIIFHKKRTSYLTCIQGRILLECLVDNKVESVILDSEETDAVGLVIIQKSIPLKISSMSEEVSIIINCPDPSWHPQDQDTVKFKTWKEFEEWKGD